MSIKDDSSYSEKVVDSTTATAACPVVEDWDGAEEKALVYGFLFQFPF